MSLEKYAWLKFFPVLDSGSVEPLLRIVNLSVRYRDRLSAPAGALQNVSLTMGTGEVIGITGPSGAGKSTLALAVLQALPRTAIVEGTIEFRGTALAPVFQEPLGALHPLLTIGRQIREAVRARRGWNATRCRAEAEASLEQAELDPHEIFGAWPHELSGGQRQRALIAQAIAGRPELVIADEPTASLDSVTRFAIMNLLKSLKARLGMSMIFITHSPALLGGFAERMFIMREGRLTAYDS